MVPYRLLPFWRFGCHRQRTFSRGQQRESRDRKDAFRGHLGRWLGVLHQPQANVHQIHAEFAPHVMGYCARLKRGFFILRRAKFTRLCEAVSMAQPNDDDYRYKIQKLIDFI